MTTLDFTPINDALKAVHRPLYYIPNRPGNWGDSLIRFATIAFLEDHKIRYKEMLPWNKKQWLLPFIFGGTVIYGGGGGWCKKWNHSCKSVQKAARRFRVIVLPSSYEMTYEIPNTTFFRRDNLGSLATMPESLFCHDLAFYYQCRVSPSQKTKKLGFFFRTDNESSHAIALPRGNTDVSSEGNHMTPIDQFLAKTGIYEEIHTDRLHVAVAAAIQGVQVNLYEGSYFKNEAIFESSFKENYSNVIFHRDNSTVERLTSN